MQPSILSKDLASSSAATAPEPPTTAGQQAPFMTLGDVPSDHYELLLSLVAAANLWQPLQVARQAWDAADAAGRTAIDDNVRAHLRSSMDLYTAITREYDALANLTQQQMLEYDTARAGAKELAADGLDGATTKSLFEALNARIETLIAGLPVGTPAREWDWRPPAVYPHLAVFHMEFGDRHLELRLSVV